MRSTEFQHHKKPATKMSLSKTLHFSSHFAISCGTVTVDLQASKVLVIYHRKTGEYLLPKGRKDINEALEATAIRETYEETGIRCKILPLSMPTLATTPAGFAVVEMSHHGGATEDHKDALITEPIAVSQRITAGTLKIIFWFAAQADSRMAIVEGTQQEGEDFDPVWVDVEIVGAMLSFDDDRQVARKVVEAAFGR